jgi:hypothetical protein
MHQRLVMRRKQLVPERRCVAKPIAQSEATGSKGFCGQASPERFRPVDSKGVYADDGDPVGEGSGGPNCVASSQSTAGIPRRDVMVRRALPPGRRPNDRSITNAAARTTISPRAVCEQTVPECCPCSGQKVPANDPKALHARCRIGRDPEPSLGCSYASNHGEAKVLSSHVRYPGCPAT